MLRRLRFTRRRLALVLLMLLVLAWGAWRLFVVGVPFEDRNYSPNGQFYAQKFRVYRWDSWVPRMSMPGGGSDYLYYIDGYVQIHTAAGVLLGEIPMDGIPMTEIMWAGNAVVVMGDGDGMLPLPARSD
jgi:hypothetical protein